MTPASAPPDPWYWSGTFWTIVGIGVTIILGVGAIVAAYRSANPVRRLFVYITDVTPLVHQAGAELGLEVSAGGEKLKDPHLVTVHLVSRGRRDIRKDAFDGSIMLKVGTRIVGMLSTSAFTKVDGTPVPHYIVRGETIEIPPALLRRDHQLGYTVLLGDGPPELSALVPVEADVRIEHPSTTADRYNNLQTLTALAVGGGSLAILPFFEVPSAVFLVVPCVVMAGLLFSDLTVMARWRR